MGRKKNYTPEEFRARVLARASTKRLALAILAKMYESEYKEIYKMFYDDELKKARKKI